MEEKETRNLKIPLTNTTDETYTPVNREKVDYSKIKLNAKTLEDALLTEISPLRRVDSRLGNKDTVLNAIYQRDYATMREISDFYFRTNGIYSRLCKYMANLYCYDWMITSYVNEDKPDQKFVLTNYHDALCLLDNFNVKKFFGAVALKVIKYGAYYGYCIVKDKTHVAV